MTIALKHGPLFPSRTPLNTQSSSRDGGEMFGLKKNHVWSNRIDFEGLAAFLRRLYPSKTAASVAADTGLPADSIKKWLNLEVQPSGRAMLALVCAYGADLVLASVKDAPDWCNRDVQKARRAKLYAEIAEIEADIEL